MRRMMLAMVCMISAFFLNGALGQSDLLFYDPTAGEGEFYTTDGSGNIGFLSGSDGWRRTWSIIVPGNFNGDGYTDLLFYDPTAGEGEFYSTDGSGNVRLMRASDGWRRTWSIIEAGNF